jgi:hydrophobic/amphiphilic exporter-1 (mainly G- bacteria), HAE1 family
MHIADISIKRPVFIVMIILGIITLGIVGYTRLPVDLLPNVTSPQISVNASYTSGYSAEEMETLITKPFENALGTVEGLDKITSTTQENRTRISVTFKLGTDLNFAQLHVQQIIQTALAKLNSSIAQPTVTIRKFSTDDIPIMVIAVNGNKNRADLTQLIYDDIENKIESTQGVGGISIFGGLDRIVKVTIDKSLLLSSGLTYSQISSAISAQNINLPIGSIYGSEKNMTLRVFGEATSIDDIGNMMITSNNGKIVRIKDIAKIEFGTVDESMRARVDGKSAVLFAVYKQSGENTVNVAKNIIKTMDELNNDLPGGISMKVVNDTSSSIIRSINGVQQDILIGALLAIIIVWFFLGNFRSTVITAVALPNSLLGAFFLIYFAGFTINTITLLSLSLAVGLLIDDSIVVRENIFRHIELGESPKIAASKGTKEVGMAVLSTTLSILAVFIPISFLQGMMGQMFRQFGLTIAFALLVSLLDAFTSAPMLSAYWYKKTNENPKGVAKIFSSLSKSWNVFYDKISNFYKKILSWSLKHKLIVISFVLLLFVGIILLSRFVGQNFMNYSDNGQFNINISTYPGAPLDKIDYFAKDIELMLIKQKEIQTFYSTIGDNNRSQAAEIRVTMKPLRERKMSTQDMMKIVRNYIKDKYDRNISYQINESSSFGGPSGGSGITINIAGNDINELAKIAEQFKRVVSEVPGATDVSSGVQKGLPEITITVDKIKAQKLGISTTELASILRTLISGSTVSTYTLGDNNYNIVLRMNEKDRSSISDFSSLTITTSKGKKLLLTSFANLNYSSAPMQISREDKKRIVKVSGNIAKGYSLNTVIANAKKAINSEIVMPQGYSYSFGGQQKDFQDFLVQIFFALILALVFMYMILASLYDSFIQPLYIMLSIPLAIVGSYFALLFTGTDLDFYGYIGLLMVFGLVVKNAILLIDFTNKQREDGFSIKEALLHAGPIRLRPILMTTFAMIFGMLPIAFGLDEGSSGRQAMPITIIGGLIFSTILTLVIIPIVYDVFEGLIEKHKKKKLEGHVGFEEITSK